MGEFGGGDIQGMSGHASVPKWRPLTLQVLGHGVHGVCGGVDQLRADGVDLGPDSPLASTVVQVAQTGLPKVCSGTLMSAQSVVGSLEARCDATRKPSRLNPKATTAQAFGSDCRGARHLRAQGVLGRHYPGGAHGSAFEAVEANEGPTQGQRKHGRRGNKRREHIENAP